MHVINVWLLFQEDCHIGIAFVFTWRTRRDFGVERARRDRRRDGRLTAILTEFVGQSRVNVVLPCRDWMISSNINGIMFFT